MVSRMSISDVLGLTVAERILLVQDIWDSIANVPEAVELTEVQRQELDARLEAYHRDPAAGSAWDVVKARISQRK
jgi:putative addiction module component (TIGR02574 family)